MESKQNNVNKIQCSTKNIEKTIGKIERLDGVKSNIFFYFYFLPKQKSIIRINKYNYYYNLIECWNYS